MLQYDAFCSRGISYVPIRRYPYARFDLHDIYPRQYDIRTSARELKIFFSFEQTYWGNYLKRRNISTYFILEKLFQSTKLLLFEVCRAMS